MRFNFFFKFIVIFIFLFIVSCGNVQNSKGALDPENLEGLEGLTQNAVEKQRIGAFEEAIQELEKALQIDPKYIEALVLVGNVYEEWEKRNEAISAYRKVLEIDPKNRDARFGLASVYGKLVRNDLAVIELEKIAENKHDDVNLTFKIAKEYWYLQDIAKTIEFYEKTLKLDPNYLQAHLNLASAYEHAKNWNKAFQQVMISIQLAKKLNNNQAISIAKSKLPFIQGRLNLTEEELNRKMQPPFE